MMYVVLFIFCAGGNTIIKAEVVFIFAIRKRKCNAHT